MKKFAAVVIALVAFGAGLGLVQAAEKTHKAVYHLNSKDIETQKDVLRNAQNHINATGKDKTDLRIVMHAGGVQLMKNALKDPEMKSSIDNLKLQGVSFNICAKTLERGKIDYKKDLYDVKQSDLVPSGVAEIAILQSKGFAYVKP
jgi:intracellular sulfur oxidation DsrE/DsrF family protein